MNYIDFSEPKDIDQLETIGAFYKAAFNLATSYGVEQPFEFVKSISMTARYDLQSQIEKQEAKPKEEVVENHDSSEDKKEEPKIVNLPDEPINLDDIPF